MSRGVVLWPDQSTSTRICALWDELDAAGVASCASHTHRLHQPHVSLIVAEHFDIDATVAAVGHAPAQPIPLHIESVGLFPGGVLFLHLVANEALLAEHRRVHDRAELHAHERWPHFTPGTWTPHLTCAWNVPDRQLATAVPILLAHLPIAGTLDRAGIEDGSTGEHWPLATPPRS